ncbi:hypothetical protein EII17_07160 [Clostridiales bacterium COT073_COT-073]|nr:hypothetical protein EII17_07160 [Clostridiales bacterium COT073_COT-073]
MKRFIKDIRENYRKLEHELVTQLSYEVEHDVTTGTNREEIWVEFFRRIIPKKFNIARSVFIIDSHENCSKEVDIAIYDEQYTPYIFNYGNIKFIPIEAVAAVVQCKSRTLTKSNLEEWVQRIESLRTSRNSIARLATYNHIGEPALKDGIEKSEKSNEDMKENKKTPTQTATAPIKILCYISEQKTTTDNSNGRNKFDIVIEAFQKEGDSETQQDLGNLKITFKEPNDLFSLYKRFNHAAPESKIEETDNLKKECLEERKISDYSIKEYSLLSFIFQFNQMLMLINNPMFFPHKAYVDMFQGTESK